MTILFILPRLFSKDSPIGQVELPFVLSLQEAGIQVDVITSDQFVESNHTFRNVWFVHESKLIVFINKVLEKLGKASMLYVPDYLRFSWNPRVKRKLQQLLREKKYDIVHTASFPSSTHLLGVYIKKKYGIPWVASFYDPWYKNPHRIPFLKRADEINKIMEHSVASNADLVFHTNSIIVQRWLDRYGDTVRNKIQVLPIVANKIDIQREKNKDIDKVVISHIGNLYSKRSAGSFIEAIFQLKNKFPNLNERLVVYLVGNVWKNDKELIAAHNLHDIIKCVGTLSEEGCQPFYINSDILLAIDGDFEDNIFFPSKLVKYFYSRKPILGLTTAGSVLEDELKKSHHKYIIKNSIDEITGYMESIVINGFDISVYDKDYCEKFNSVRIAKYYIDCVKQYLTNNAT